MASLTIGIILGDGECVYQGHRLLFWCMMCFYVVDLWVKYEWLTLQLESFLMQQQSSLNPFSL